MATGYAPGNGPAGDGGVRLGDVKNIIFRPKVQLWPCKARREGYNSNNSELKLGVPPEALAAFRTCQPRGVAGSGSKIALPGIGIRRTVQGSSELLSHENGFKFQKSGARSVNQRKNMKITGFVLFSVLAFGALSSAQTPEATRPEALTTPYDAAFKGTYTVGLASTDLYWVMYNTNNQQVGFNTGEQTPYNYGSNVALGQSIFKGTIVADGAGHITSGTFSLTPDPNEVQCSPKNNPAPDCPYTVPSGKAWSGSTSYVIGDVVDYEGHSYQAVAANEDAAPVLVTIVSNAQKGNACAANSSGYDGPPKCTWVVLYGSATGEDKSGTGTLTGTYSVLANGTGTMAVTLNIGGTTTCSSTTCKNLEFVILVPPNAAGQEIHIIAQSLLGNKFAGTGVAIRQ